MLTIIILTAAVSAAPAPKPDNLSKSLVAYFTEMAVMKAPTWIVPGLRVAYLIDYEDKKDPANNRTGYLIYDVIDVKADYVASITSSSDQVDGLPRGMVFGGLLLDYPVVGRFWITPELFEDGSLQTEKAAILYRTKVNLDNVAYEAVLLGLESSTASRTIAFEEETGLLLLVDMRTMGSTGEDLTVTTIEYVGARQLFPPWEGLLIEGLATGSQLKYEGTYIGKDMIEKQTMDLKVTENNGSWAALERIDTFGDGTKRTTQTVSSFSSGDGYLFWLPTALLEALREGDTVFDDDLIISSVRAGGIVEDAVLGRVRSLIFVDRAAQTECIYSLKTGFMLSLHQKPIVEDVQEVIFKLISVR
jgi:hypothetical protein